MTKAVGTINVGLTDEAKAVIDQAIEAMKVVRRENEQLREEVEQLRAAGWTVDEFLDSTEAVEELAASLGPHPQDPELRVRRALLILDDWKRLRRRTTSRPRRSRQGAHQ